MTLTVSRTLLFMQWQSLLQLQFVALGGQHYSTTKISHMYIGHPLQNSMHKERQLKKKKNSFSKDGDLFSMVKMADESSAAAWLNKLNVLLGNDACSLIVRHFKGYSHIQNIQSPGSHGYTNWTHNWYGEVWGASDGHAPWVVSPHEYGWTSMSEETLNVSENHQI